MAVGAEQNGKVVTLHPGQQLTVTLASTYWDLSVDQPDGVVSVVSTSTSAGGAACRGAVMGSGCGTATIVVRAEHAGSTSVVGRRSTCGEALRCAPGQDSYAVRVDVTG